MSDADHLPIGPRYVLLGRLVTMGPLGVIPRGAVYVDAGRIAAVQRAVDPPPAGFEDAPIISTGDSIYPGLIELHNHLSYNAMPLWDVPKKYTNSGQWKNHDDYRRLITKPSQVIGRTPGIVEAVVRFVECRCLLGGVTTSQGITLANASGIVSFYDGYVRNVERSTHPDMPDAGTRIANPDTGKAAEYLETLQRNTCYLQHLSEGTDTAARGWFHRLRIDGDDWAVTGALCGIHSTALDADDFRVLGDRGATMVWSPLSNLLLYGKTADMRAVKDAGVLTGIGCDWAPSGSKNLLGELKVAWLVNEEQGGVFTPEEIVSMATVNAARILKWDRAIGTIAPGMFADLICVDGQQGDDYLRLIRARETSVTLVIIDGVPRAGQGRLMQPFQVGTEEITIGRSQRVLNLAQENAHPLVRGLSLTEATARLRDALHNLPALAEAIDNASAGGLFSGSADGTGSTWRMVPDFEEEDRALEIALGLADIPLAELVQPLELDGITVADDPLFLKRIVAARNVPEYVKKGLPPLYGLRVPLPESAEFLLDATEPLPPQLLETQSLKDVVRVSGELSLADRRTIVDQALVLLEEHYVHLPLKRAMHAVDPVQRLRLLRHRLEDVAEEDMGPEIEFHDEMTRIFNSLRDLHTAYRLPSPFKEKTAWLPFLVEEIVERGERAYLVTKVVADAGPASFVPGVELLHWNGTPIRRVVDQNAHRQAGSNAAARHARGLNTLTIRPLVRGLPPDEEWVTLRYRGLDGAVHEWTQEWLVFEPGRSRTSLDPEALLTETTALGLDAQTDDVQEARKVLFAGTVLIDEMRGVSRRALRRTTGGGIDTLLPTVFRAYPVTTEAGTFGYVRIFTFNVSDAQVFVDEFVRLLGELPDNGLIIDVRGNAGGLIPAAERLLQVLTPRRIEPQKAEFINTPLNLQLCRAWRNPSSRFPDFSLGAWVESIAQSVETGAVFSLGFPITPDEAVNDLGQKYSGPKVLITDALCYSATDMFAAAFQDHGIGPILGVDQNTGAGGANVWSHRLLLELMSGASGIPAGPPYAPLPHGADLRVAIRRVVRVGPRAGSLIEDLGIVPDRVHAMTRNDVLRGNVDLLAEAARMLAAMSVHAVKATVPADAPAPSLDVETRNVDWFTVLIDGRPRRSFDATDGVVSIALRELIGEASGSVVQIEIQGYRNRELVAAARTALVP